MQTWCTRNGVLGVVLLGLSLSLAATAYSDNRHDDRDDRDYRGERESVCEQTAASMFKACLFDVGDTLHVGLSNCYNMGTRAQRRACIEETRAARKADTEECGEIFEARENACEVLGENRYDPDPLLDPANMLIDPDDIPTNYPPNPYLSLAAGHTYVLREGADGEELVVVHVTGEKREILGAQCRVVLDVVLETSEEDGVVSYEAVEVTNDWFAQDRIGNTYYCGEAVQNFEDGVLRDLDGSFEAGRELAKSGFLLHAYPVAGAAHRQEFALDEAEDIVQYVSVATAPTADEGGDNLAFPCSPSKCLKTFDFQPTEPGKTELKYYLPGTGFVLGVGVEDGELTGERAELLCVGDSLDVLSDDAACGIAEPAGLLGVLCRLAPDAFCLED
jgi:hypothetical protein